MNKIILQRFPNENDQITFGKLYLDWIPDHKDIYTLEPPKGDYGKGYCIPQGLYNVRKYYSKAHPDVWKVLNVPGREDILIHIGNYPSDTTGCILVGLGIEEDVHMITNSRYAIKYLRSILGENSFSLEVKN